MPLRDVDDISVGATQRKGLPARGSSLGREGGGGGTGRGGSEQDNHEDGGLGSSDADSLLGRRNGLAGGLDYPQMDLQLMDMEKMREKRRVRTFIEARFQEHVMATVCIDGAWRHTAREARLLIHVCV